MEFVILAGLAVAGYELSKNGKVPRKGVDGVENKSLLKDNNKYPFRHESKTTNPNMIDVPYYSSKSYGHDTVFRDNYENYSQNRMETFTGTSDVIFKHKKECENIFKPEKDVTHINGAPIALDEANRSDRYSYAITNQMHNVAPTEKIYVGPGLGIGTHTPATGGFHDTFRILPNNVGGYKKNSFGGRVVSGKGITQNRDALPSIQDNSKPERFYSICDRHVAPGKARYNAQQGRGEYFVQSTNRGHCQDGYTGGPSFVDTTGFEQRSATTRDYDSTKCNTYGNPNQQSAGNYGTGVFAMKSTQREECISASNVRGNNGYKQRYVDGAAPTLRGDANKYEGHIHNSTISSGGYKTNGYNAKLTEREQTSSSYNGAPTYMIPGNAKYAYNARMTHREDVNSDATGPAASIHKGNQNRMAQNNACPYYQREEMGVEYTPNGGRMNIREDANKIVANAEFTPDCNKHPITHGKGRNAISNVDTQGDIEFAPKIPVSNQRQDFTIARNQLQNNPYAPKYH